MPERVAGYAPALARTKKPQQAPYHRVRCGRLCNPQGSIALYTFVNLLSIALCDFSHIVPENLDLLYKALCLARLVEADLSQSFGRRKSWILALSKELL